MNVLNTNSINSVRCLTGKGGCEAHVLEMNSKEEPHDNIITRFQHHPSKITIGQNRSKETFHFPYSQQM